MKRALIIIIFNLAVVPAMAQQRFQLNDRLYGSEEVEIPPTPTQGATVNVQLQDQTHTWIQPLPVLHRTADRAFWLWQVASALATAADDENSYQVLKRVPGTRELNPVYGSHPGRALYYGIGFGVWAAEVPFAYHWKRQDDALRAAGIPGHRWAKWWVMPALNAGAHGVGIGVTVGVTGR